MAIMPDRLAVNIALATPEPKLDNFQSLFLDILCGIPRLLP